MGTFSDFRLQRFLKQVVKRDLGDDVLRIGVSLQSIGGDESGNDATRVCGLLLEKGKAVHEFVILIFANEIRLLAVFRLAKVNHAVGTLDDEVDLCLLQGFRVNAAPRIILRLDAINAECLLDLRYVRQANALKCEAHPCIDGRSVQALRPEMLVGGTAFHELEIEK